MEENFEKNTIERAVLVGLNAACFTKEQTATDETIEELEAKFAGEGRVLIRPSGTEPKIKIYILANGSSREEVQDKIAKYQEFAEKLAQ